MASLYVRLVAYELRLRLLGLTEDQMDQAIVALAQQLDDVTNRIAADVDAIKAREQALIDQANNASSGMVPAADVVAALGPNVTKLGTLAEALAELGKDPNNPVPNVV